MQVRRTALIAHPAERIFALIEAAEDYPAFLPWCRAATILERTDDIVVARLELAWHGLRFGFVTRNPKRAPTWMAIGLEEGPFRHFAGQWVLTPLAAWGCRVEFSLDYEFDAALIGSIAGPLFDKATNSLVDAFVRRADSLPPAPALTPPLAQAPTPPQSPPPTPPAASSLAPPTAPPLSPPAGDPP